MITKKRLKSVTIDKLMDELVVKKLQLYLLLNTNDS